MILTIPSEHESQVMLINWSLSTAAMQTTDRKRIALSRFHSIPNGAAVARRADARNPGAKQGGKLKAEGLKSATSDLFLPYPRGYDPEDDAGDSVYCHGAYIEMKRYGEKPRKDQAEFMEDARTLGYRAEWFDLWQDAAEFIVGYMRLTVYRYIEPPLWLKVYQAANAEDRARSRGRRVR